MSLGVPNLSIPRESKVHVSQARLEALAGDFAKLEMDPTIKLAGSVAVPTFQRQGYLEKLGHSRMKWFKRFFVLRDSFMLSYNLQKSDFTTEPRSAIHLGNCKLNTQAIDPSNSREFCFAIATESGDQFLFCCSSEAEKQSWLDDIMVARLVTHSNMVKVAIENQCLAEEKGVASVAREASTSSLSLFSNPAYVQSTPLTGGMEGWLHTGGFNDAFKNEGGPKKGWKRCYFMLRDSHLLLFNAGDMLSKPRGVMYLVGVSVELGEGDEEMPNRIVVGSRECGDMIELASSSTKSQKRWFQALKVGTRVTHPDYILLEKERQLLASLVLTPRAPTPRGPGGKMQTREHTPSVLDEEVDALGNQLAPGAVQPYDAQGNPLIRDPSGNLVNSATNETVTAAVPRFSAAGEQLDAFNRPLPPDAVPMFNDSGVPIGVGPDGLHYTPDGEVVDKHAAHFDKDGKRLTQDVVNNSDMIAPTIAVAVKVRAMLKGSDAAPEVVDALGRTFKSNGDDNLITADGQKVPTTARRVEVGGKLMTYEEAKKQTTVETPVALQSGKLTIKMEHDDGEQELGSVDIDSTVTLHEVRGSIASHLSVPSFVFLVDGVQLTTVEEKTKLAFKYLPEISIRGKELTVERQKGTFTTKISFLQQEQEQKSREQNEFSEIMNKVRNKTFLQSVGRDLTK